MQLELALEVLKSNKKTREHILFRYRHEFAEQLQHFIQINGITICQLAKKLGRSSSFVKELLSGNIEPTLNLMADIELALSTEHVAWAFKFSKMPKH